MADDGPVPSDEDGTDIEDDVIDALRRCNPVEVAALPSDRSSEAARALELILTSDDRSDESSPSPTRDEPCT